MHRAGDRGRVYHWRALALAEREEIKAGERNEETAPQKKDAPQHDSQEATGESSEDEQQNPLLTEITVIAMGRLGGAENGFGSDADVMFVHRPVEGADEGEAQAQANRIVNRLMQLIKQPVRPAIRAERPLEVDADLRPEGKQGGDGALGWIRIAPTMSAGQRHGSFRRSCGRARSPVLRSWGVRLLS